MKADARVGAIIDLLQSLLCCVTQPDSAPLPIFGIAGNQVVLTVPRWPLTLSFTLGSSESYG
ncbi:hypothetical protein NQZ68_036319 [Dissostichus eleginoides]|nr:hypothetical protein NQZ68_036319 [Dissostichus eleginoides]